jgi:hypothetical protein
MVRQEDGGVTEIQRKPAQRGRAGTRTSPRTTVDDIFTRLSRLHTRCYLRMPRLSAFLCLALLASTTHASAQLTRVRRLQGSDRRGHFDLSWIELTERAASATVRARVNADLEREARLRLCEPGDGAAKDLSSEFETRLTHLDARLLSLATSEFVVCGGAHPNHIPTALLYDLRTGRRIDVEAEMVSPRAFRRFVARRAAAVAPHRNDCRDAYSADQLNGTGFIYLLSQRTLNAVPDFAQVSLACGFDVEIPWADVAPFVKSASPLRWLARRR